MREHFFKKEGLDYNAVSETLADRDWTYGEINAKNRGKTPAGA